ncbi:MAG TPA: Rieske (2Fe-2S) protein [Burkholderiaceae bacterium]|nr:Rieske (2Fe-2S) protein [Burkholderiaceae bacterium]
MNTLYPIGLSTALENEQVMLARCGGQEVAVWRDSQGTLHANQNRCAHRGMRLHLGFVRDDQLRCPYHGWAYDGSGQCKHIPAHPDIVPAKTICLKTYTVRETNSVIWLAPQPALAGAPEEAHATTALPADLQATPVRSLYLQIEVDRLAQAFQALLAAPFANEATATQLVAVSGNQASWLLGERQIAVAYERIALGAGSEAVLVHGEGLAPQGLVYALQDCGGGQAGIHVSALWRGAAPAAYRLGLSQYLRRVEWFLKNEVALTTQWSPFSQHPGNEA